MCFQSHSQHEFDVTEGSLNSIGSKLKMKFFPAPGQNQAAQTPTRHSKFQNTQMAWSLWVRATCHILSHDDCFWQHLASSVMMRRSQVMVHNVSSRVMCYCSRGPIHAFTCRISEIIQLHLSMFNANLV